MHIALAENQDIEGEFRLTKFWFLAEILSLLVSVGKIKRFTQTFFMTRKSRRWGYVHQHLSLFQKACSTLQIRYILTAREKTINYPFHVLY